MDIVGVGYKAEIKGKSILFALGYSHSIEFVLPDGVYGKGREAAADDQSISDEHHPRRVATGTCSARWRRICTRCASPMHTKEKAFATLTVR